jgi:hypothetical protein
MRQLIVLAALFPIWAAAETAYVTDSLRLRLYSDAELTNVIETLASGDQLDVVSRNNTTALVRIADGRQGYVSAGYIVYDKPAKLIVAESQAEAARLSGEIEELRASFAEPAQMIDGLQTELAELRSMLEVTGNRAAALEAENRSLVDRQARYRYSLPYAWVGGAMLVCLASGFFVGLWWIDRQSRKRHGGIRVL